MKDERYEKLESSTGEVTELLHTIAVDQETWFQLYSNVFCYAIASIKSLINIKVFAVCLKCSVWDDKHGNVISGCKDPVIEKFVVHFRKDIKLNTNNNCPNCGAPLNGITCSYCETVVTNKNDFKISSIKRIV